MTIPYGTELAERVPPAAVRLRRDFRAILSLIRAHAVLHQETRERDGEDRIVANLEDYRAVPELVAEIVAEYVEAMVSKTIRETVDAVTRILSEGQTAATVKDVAEKLGLDKSSTSRRVSAARNEGYLCNREERRGHPLQLVLGDPLPEQMDLLPTPEALQGCTVARAPERLDTPPSPRH